jgi:formate dehydrogenase major subunit
LVTGDSTNDLIGFVADGNVSIQESKCFTAMIEAGRKSRGRHVPTSGPLVRQIDEMKWERDLPHARGNEEAQHDAKQAESKESN